MIGGVFILLAAVMAFASGGMLIVGSEIAEDIDPTGMLEDALVVCGAIEMVFGIIALMGAVMALTGKSWGLAIVGGIFGLLGVGLWGLGFIFGLIGLILVAISKDEFEGQMPMAPQQGMYPPPGQYPVQQPPPGYPPQQQPPAQPPMEQPPAQPPMEQPPAQPPMEQPPEAPPQVPPKEPDQL